MARNTPGVKRVVNKTIAVASVGKGGKSADFNGEKPQKNNDPSERQVSRCMDYISRKISSVI